jgi:hypothetical protein
MEFSVQLDVRRRKSQHTENLGDGRRLPEAIVEIVGVVEKNAAGSRGLYS